MANNAMHAYGASYYTEFPREYRFIVVSLPVNALFVYLPLYYPTRMHTRNTGAENKTRERRVQTDAANYNEGGSSVSLLAEFLCLRLRTGDRSEL